MKNSLVIFLVVLCFCDVFSFRAPVPPMHPAPVPPPVVAPVGPIPYPVPVVMPILTFDDGMRGKRKRPMKRMKKTKNMKKNN
ncbi:hypothetical protein BpHYR1_023409 [Brachionus plicatilis]|uniref:Uncharacterized protein n=1 Tax=Brachionus plicatilis TaxID=10195 RepID=A0A3M7QZV5_BRAPC|nr:hypothetical protein BpHYR1_023409 [Brachionus plicatilis]